MLSLGKIVVKCFFLIVALELPKYDIGAYCPECNFVNNLPIFTVTRFNLLITCNERAWESSWCRFCS